MTKLVFGEDDTTLSREKRKQEGEELLLCILYQTFSITTERSGLCIYLGFLLSYFLVCLDVYVWYVGDFFFIWRNATVL